jgi:hypothetical protein
MGKTKDPRTVAVSNGVAADRTFKAVAPPIYLTSTFAFAGYERSLGHEYTRTSNPTRDLLSETLAKLEGGAGAVVTASGMASVDLVLSLLRRGDLVLAPHDCYGGTYRLLAARQERENFDVVFVDQGDALTAYARGRYPGDRRTRKGSRRQGRGRQHLSVSRAAAPYRPRRGLRHSLDHQVSQRTFRCDRRCRRRCRSLRRGGTVRLGQHHRYDRCAVRCPSDPSRAADSVCAHGMPANKCDGCGRLSGPASACCRGPLSGPPISSRTCLLLRPSRMASARC